MTGKREISKTKRFIGLNTLRTVNVATILIALKHTGHLSWTWWQVAGFSLIQPLVVGLVTFLVLIIPFAISIAIETKRKDHQ